ncbi:MAG: alpha/beta hydrolase [bacterium]|nr:alpha/beta hydrolase [bacterium]
MTELLVRGARVSASCGGREPDPSLPLLVFVHGAALDRTCWQLQSRYFAFRGFSVVAVDLPGHGRSEGPLCASVEEYADWLAELVEAAGYHQAHLVGHSMGALITLEAAARHPGRISSLTLCGGAAAIPVHPGLLSAAQNGDDIAYRLMASWGHSRRSHLGGHPTPGLWMMGGSIRLWERTPPGVLASDLAACDSYRRGREAARQVGCPTLLISGSQDIMTPNRSANPLRKGIKTLAEVTIEDAGHIMIVEQPDRVIDALDGFLTGL